MSKKFNGHRCERRNLTDLVLGTGPTGKKRPEPKAKKRSKNFTTNPAANTMLEGGPTGEEAIAGAMPSALELAAANQMNRMVNPMTGQIMKETHPLAASYIDNNLMDLPNRPYLTSQSTGEGSAWSAGTVSDLMAAKNPNFRKRLAHAQYVNDALEGANAADLQVRRTNPLNPLRPGTALVRGRGEMANAKYKEIQNAATGDAYQKAMYEDQTGIPLHGDVIVGVNQRRFGRDTYQVQGGNMGDSLLMKDMTARQIRKEYPMMLQRYGGPNVPQYFGGGGTGGSGQYYRQMDRYLRQSARQGPSLEGLTGPELMEAIKNQNIEAGKANMLGTGLGVAGNLVSSMGEGEDARPDDPYKFTDALGGALSGAGQGAMFGLPGMLIGGAFGLGKSLFNHQKDKNEFNRMQAEAKDERTEMNVTNAQDFSTQVLNTYNQEGVGGSYYARQGGPVDYETEKSEVILASPNDPPIAMGQGKYKQKSSNLYQGKGPSHEMGGIPTKGATEPFQDSMGQKQDSPYVFSDAKEMRFDPSSILSMIA